MESPEITFFMIVTPRDAVIADYAIRSYSGITGLDFRLAVYSNYMLPEQKQHYFPRWERLPFVRIERNDHQDVERQAMEGRIQSEKLEGPFEYCDPLWDRELRKIRTPFVATVDADLEILRPRFVTHMMERLRTEPDLVGYSTDYSQTEVVFESFSGKTIIMNERNHTWFCIYKRLAFERSKVSQGFHKEISSDRPEPSCWDSAAYFQKSLRDQGLRFAHLEAPFRRDFIHYGAFSKNTVITRRTVPVFRKFTILESRVPAAIGRVINKSRRVLLPRLENNRYVYNRETPIEW